MTEEARGVAGVSGGRVGQNKEDNRSQTARMQWRILCALPAPTSSYLVSGPGERGSLALMLMSGAFLKAAEAKPLWEGSCAKETRRAGCRAPSLLEVLLPMS